MGVALHMAGHLGFGIMVGEMPVCCIIVRYPRALTTGWDILPFCNERRLHNAGRLC